MEPTPITSSASPEDTLLGVDPDDTAEVNLKGARFVLQVLPAGIWDSFSTRSQLAFSSARRRAIASLAAQGLNPDEEMYTIGKLSIVRADTEASADPQYRAEMCRLYVDCLRFGLKEMSGFKNRKGEDFVLEKQQTKVGQIMVEANSLECLKVFESNVKVAEILWRRLRDLNEIGDDAKKS